MHTGAAGTGHFTKMVHNGIEYGLMQAYAEGYELLARSGLDIDAQGALSAWRQGSVVRSWLLDLFVRALEQRPGLDGLAPVAQDSGEGRWTVQEAIERGVATPVISAALYARFVSQDQEGVAMRAIAALREQFGGHAVLPEDAPGEAEPPVAPADPAAHMTDDRRAVRRARALRRHRRPGQEEDLPGHLQHDQDRPRPRAGGRLRVVGVGRRPAAPARPRGDRGEGRRRRGGVGGRRQAHLLRAGRLPRPRRRSRPSPTGSATSARSARSSTSPSRPSCSTT